MTNQFPFKVLFCFENESKLIVEIKRTDIQSEDKSLVYKWLLIQHENLIQVLTLRSMVQNGEKQVREFAEGILEWNETKAHFNGEAMTPIESDDVSYKSLELISNFLGTS
jgi:hypothetical protein